MEKQVMYVCDLAAYFGLTESAIRTHIYRQNWNAVPKPMRVGGKIGWRKTDVDEWLRQKAEGEKKCRGGTRKEDGEKKGRGRPRKR